MNPIKRLLTPSPTEWEDANYRSIWRYWHIDGWLLAILLILSAMGMVILYSAAGTESNIEFRQLFRLGFAFLVMIIVAQISPTHLRIWAPWLYAIAIILLVFVLAIGTIGKGAQRWLNLGIISFQPSELMKLALPMTIAWYLSDCALPPAFKRTLIACALILAPALLIAKQPDLGTALMIAVAGFTALFLAGLSWSLITSAIVLVSAAAPVLWHFLHDYQRQRVLTFLNPENDPLGTGYHIIQSKIAIGSGGMFGKGWMQGTQSHLDFLPEHATDFIFAVCGEEFGLIGCLLLLTIYFLVIGRGFYIAMRAQDTFSRILAASLTMMFFFSFFVNMGMVTGILPVVGVPLPLVSYGGTSMVTMMASFGILMSIRTHRKLVGS